jgi:hypothetical protein
LGGLWQQAWQFGGFGGFGEFGDTKHPEKAVILPATSGIIHHFTQKKPVEMGEFQENIWVGHGIT